MKREPTAQCEHHRNVQRGVWCICVGADNSGRKSTLTYLVKRWLVELLLVSVRMCMHLLYDQRRLPAVSYSIGFGTRTAVVYNWYRCISYKLPKTGLQVACSAVCTYRIVKARCPEAVSTTRR